MYRDLGETFSHIKKVCLKSKNDDVGALKHERKVPEVEKERERKTEGEREAGKGREKEKRDRTRRINKSVHIN